jgi:flagellar biosynthesis protein FlhA
VESPTRERLETLADRSRITKDPEALTEYARAALGRAITAQYRDAQGDLHVVALSPRTERKIEESLQMIGGMGVLVLEPETVTALLRNLATRMEHVAASGSQPVVLCSPRLRAPLHRWLENSIRNPVVLSYAEVSPPAQVRAAGTVDLAEAA